MSFSDWSKKYYATPAREVADSKSDDLVVVRHSLQKWRGLLPSVLDKFNLVMVHQPFTMPVVRTVQGVTQLPISSDSCSMCLRYVCCSVCPLFACTGLDCGEPGSAFEEAVDRPTEENVRGMIDALRATEAMLESGYDWQGHNHEGPSWIVKTDYTPTPEE